jgi:xanthine dehydrogenase accessory factor
MGLTDDERARVRTPVGLAIGARTPEEIALSILGDIVRAIRVDGLVAPATSLASAPREVVDPVCGMTVVVLPDTPHLTVDGQDYWFCNPGCRDRFAASAGR